MADWERANPAALAAFDPATKRCTMNCGPAAGDPRSSAERRLLCDECQTLPPRDERADFEAWAQRRLQLDVRRCAPPEDGFYADQATMTAWLAWDARATGAE